MKDIGTENPCQHEIGGDSAFINLFSYNRPVQRLQDFCSIVRTVGVIFTNIMEVLRAFCPNNPYFSVAFAEELAAGKNHNPRG